MSYPVYDHVIPDALRRKFTNWETFGVCKKCPICIVRSHIAEIKEIQAGLGLRRRR
jgi:hypothetical protein